MVSFKKVSAPKFFGVRICRYMRFLGNFYVFRYERAIFSDKTLVW